MTVVSRYFRELTEATLGGWNRFWFTPTDPATLGLVRILAGAMLLYTHLVWTLDLQEFFGDKAWISPSALAVLPQGAGGWSLFNISTAPAWLWTVHLAGLAVFALLTVGYRSRVTAAAAWIVTLSYAHRAPLALFGLDQINALLAMYLMVGDCGGAYSVDRWLVTRRAGALVPVVPNVSTSVAIRLIQVHMCVIYFFAGTAKLAGVTWWNGQALWGALANLEYQTLDLTWLANHERWVNLMTHVTVYWEIGYAALVWPRLTRPIVLAIAVPLHLGIGLAMGMMTFGLVMLIANVAFVSPALVRHVLRGRAMSSLPQSTSTAQENAATPSGPKARSADRRATLI